MKKTFSRMTAAQKRVAIAKDALAQIRAQKFKMTKGTYWMIPRSEWKNGEDSVFGKNELRRLQKPCKVCADGALALSAIRKFNQFEVGVSDEANGIDHQDVLSKWFSASQISLIEWAFEGWDSAYFDSPSDKASKWGKRFKSNESRAIALFQNIIDNKGTFKP